MNTPGMKLRLKALFFDWIFISAYLILLFLLAMAFYFVVFHGPPTMNLLQSQLIATVTSILPIIIIFSVMEGRNRCASPGKRKTGLTVHFYGNSLRGSILRNTFKFLPWQLGHMSTINGIYNDFETMSSMIFFILSMALVVLYFAMTFLRKDHRHLPDLIARSIVVVNDNKKEESRLA